MKRALAPAASQSQPIGFVDLEGKSGMPTPSYRNTIIAIDLLGLVCRYDVLHDRYTVNGSAFGNSVLQVSDAIARKLRIIVRDQFKFEPGPQSTMDAIYAACEANRYNPVLDYLDACKWDGVKPIDTWL